MDTVQLVDTTFRDGHASLWAERMTTGMMLAVAEEMDRCQFVAMEVIATSHFKKCVRELKEDPWERLRLLSRTLRHTPMAAMSGASPPNTFGITPDAMILLYYQRLKANGVRRVQLMEPSNDMERVRPTLRLAHDAGLEVVLALVYTLSPRHTDAYYAEKAAQGIRMGADRVYLKDPGGLLTPDRIPTLIPAIQRQVKDVPLELHSHCTTGLAPLVYLEAIRCGIRTLHTAVPPLANGSAQPSMFNFAANARALGFEVAVDEAPARRASQVLTEIATRERLPIGVPLEYDHAQYLHQIPGGVISNLKHQLQQLGLLDRLPEVLEETIRVRQELGYPIMVTPFSQFVVSQATMNVLLGERYKEVTDEVIKYALGIYGQEASAAVEPDVQHRILERTRARELANWQPPNPSLQEIRQTLGGTGVSDDELVLRYIMGGAEEVQKLHRAPPIQPYVVGASPLVELVGYAARQPRWHLVIDRPGFHLAVDSGLPTEKP